MLKNTSNIIAGCINVTSSGTQNKLDAKWRWEWRWRSKARQNWHGSVQNTHTGRVFCSQRRNFTTASLNTGKRSGAWGQSRCLKMFSERKTVSFCLVTFLLLWNTTQIFGGPCIFLAVGGTTGPICCFVQGGGQNWSSAAGCGCVAKCCSQTVLAADNVLQILHLHVQRTHPAARSQVAKTSITRRASSHPVFAVAKVTLSRRGGEDGFRDRDPRRLGAWKVTSALREGLGSPNLEICHEI